MSASHPTARADQGRAAARPPPPPRRTQAERSEQTRRLILDAAVDLLATKGYAGLRTADVARIAGVSKGAQAHHFPSKDDLVVAVVEHVFQRAATMGRRRAHRAATPDAAVQALIADSREFFFSELFLVALDLAIQHRMSERGVNPVNDIAAAARLPVEESWLAALVESGVPAALAEDLLWLTNSIVRGLAVRRLWQHDPARFERLFRLWRRMVGEFLEGVTTRTVSRASPATRPASGSKKTRSRTP